MANRGFQVSWHEGNAHPVEIERNSCCSDAITVPKLIDAPISDAYIMRQPAIPPTNEGRSVCQSMSEGKDADRSRRKKRRGQLDREKETRRAEQSRTSNLESKTKDEKAKLDLRIGKLID